LKIVHNFRINFEISTKNNFFLLVRGNRPGKNVQLTEAEIRGLCLKSREIFLSQPILLELEAPLKICGMFKNIKSYKPRIFKKTTFTSTDFLKY
jgi:hypothetical protein